MSCVEVPKSAEGSSGVDLTKSRITRKGFAMKKFMGQAPGEVRWSMCHVGAR